MISIIVPVFNGEKHILQCINSLLSQSLRDFEIILIDDGSTDSTPRIIGELHNRHRDKIKVFRQANSGVSAARNKGIELAQGEFVTFVDSDDWVENNYLSDLMSQPADLVVSGLILQNSSPSIIATNSQLFNLKQDKDSFYNLLQSRLLNGPCQKLFKSQLLHDFQITFPLFVQFGEDRIFNYNYLRHVNTISVINRASYHYRIAESGSLCSTFNPEIDQCQLKQWRTLMSLIDDLSLHSEKIDQKLYHELFFEVIADNLMNNEQLSYRKTFKIKYDYCARILSIPEIDQLPEHFNKIECSKWIKHMISNRGALCFTIYSYIAKLSKYLK